MWLKKSIRIKKMIWILKILSFSCFKVGKQISMSNRLGLEISHTNGRLGLHWLIQRLQTNEPNETWFFRWKLLKWHTSRSTSSRWSGWTWYRWAVEKKIFSRWYWRSRFKVAMLPRLMGMIRKNMWLISVESNGYRIACRDLVQKIW